MAAINQRDVMVEIDVAGTPTDITAGCVEVQFGANSTIGEYATLDSEWGKAARGVKRGTGRLVVLIEPGATTAYGYLRSWVASGEARTMSLYTPDDDTGSRSETFEAVPESLDPMVQGNANGGDVQKATFTFRSDGEVTPSIIA
jgi:hypothetical protein